MRLPETTLGSNTETRIDWRERLYNDGLVGPMTEVSLPRECVQQLRGILLDFDPKIYKISPFTQEIPPDSPDPTDFYNMVVRPWLDRHELACNAEVRVSGTGIHAILWFAEPVQLETDGARDRWGGIVKVIQASLPVDPDQPNILAHTRPIGSINGKNGSEVTQLTPGRPVGVEAVIACYKKISTSPFRTVFEVLTGDGSVTPCPICKDPDTTLVAMDRGGRCYGSCGNVNLTALYDVVLAPRESVSREGVPHDV